MKVIAEVNEAAPVRESEPIDLHKWTKQMQNIQISETTRKLLVCLGKYDDLYNEIMSIYENEIISNYPTEYKAQRVDDFTDKISEKGLSIALQDLTIEHIQNNLYLSTNL